RSGRESDLLAFEIGVKDSGVQSVMCSYNLLNGTWACENPYLLTQVLKTDWGFSGFVMSDWWAIPSAVPDGTVVAALAGLDQEQPNSVNFSASLLEAAVAAGEIPQSRVDDMATRVLTAMYQLGVFTSRPLSRHWTRPWSPPMRPSRKPSRNKARCCSRIRVGSCR